MMIYKFKVSKQLEQTKTELENLKQQTEEAAEFIKEIEKGNLQINASDTLDKSELGVSLLSMQKHLAKIAIEEAERTWANTGLAKFSDILRNKQSYDLKELAEDILVNLVKYVKANQGAIFVLEENTNGEDFLEMIACYAYERKKYLNKRIELGNGLAGQCVLEKETIYLTEIPNEYIKITSGLGDAAPRSVLISPLLINEKVFGVIELASFEQFQPYKIDFINRLAENIASSIKNVKDSERTQALLNASQQQAEELRAQEEEMRQNMEEMQATQEEMARKSEEIAKVAAESEGLIGGINATMATIEFSPDGIVMNANDNFLKTMKYALTEVKGKHHRNFVPKEILDSEDYKTFWTRLAAGTSISGIFKRINSKDETVWLNAIYNPIFNSNGEVGKVVKFATDITAEQEMLAENKGVLNGINTTMATIEFSPDGIVLNANDNFLKTMKYAIVEIKGKHHKHFVPKEILDSEDYKTFWSRLAAGSSNSGIFKRINSKGETVWLNAIYNPISNANGEVIKVVKFATDITLEQEMLAENKGIINGINSTMATIEFGPDGVINVANDNFLKAMGYTLAEVTGKHHRQFVPKTILDSDEYKTFWTKLADGIPNSGIFERINSQGQPVWLNAIYNPILDASGKVFKVVKFATDITAEKEKEFEIKQLLEESKAQEEEIRQNLEEMQSIQEGTERILEEKTFELKVREEVFGITSILSEADLFGNILYANEKLSEVSKYSTSELIGKPHNIFRHPDMPKELFKLFWETLKKGEIFKGIIKNKAKDGTHYWVDGCFVPIKDKKGNILKYIGARYHIENDEIALMMYNEQATKLGLQKLKV